MKLFNGESGQLMFCMKTLVKMTLPGVLRVGGKRARVAGMVSVEPSLLEKRVHWGSIYEA